MDASYISQRDATSNPLREGGGKGDIETGSTSKPSDNKVEEFEVGTIVQQNKKPPTGTYVSVEEDESGSRMLCRNPSRS